MTTTLLGMTTTIHSHALRPVRHASMILAGVTLRTTRPNRPVIAIRLVRLWVHRLLRALADVAGCFLRSVPRLLRGLLDAMADVAGGFAHVMTGRLSALGHVPRRPLRFVLDVDRRLVQLLANAIQSARFLHAAMVRARLIGCDDRVIRA